MAKYSYEFKLQVVQAYLDGEGGYYYLCQPVAKQRKSSVGAGRSFDFGSVSGAFRSAAVSSAVHAADSRAVYLLLLSGR